MSTRGLRIIRFGGRYFIYYNHRDSYPSGLGHGLVCSIPADPEQYREWLQGQRAFYAGLTEDLERNVLTVPEESLRDFLATEGTAHERDENRKVWPSWKDIDSELQELPTALCDVGNDLWIEWTYIIDLDNELFCVNNWIFFHLWNIPRDRWIQAFGFDEGQRVFSFEICPEGSAGISPPDYFRGDPAGESNKYRAMYQQYGHSTVEAISSINIFSRAAIHQIVAIMLFKDSTTPDASYFWEYVPGWRHESFAFREIAFAILSFAAGQYYLDDPNRFYGYHNEDEPRGYLIDRNEGGEPNLMPLFGSGFHLSDQEAGSAPISSIYWFENVLVSLVPDTVFENDTEAAVAKAVEYGLEEGKTNFQIVVFSIFNAIMLEVDIKDGVRVIRRTEAVSIYNPSRMNGPDNTVEDGVDDCPDAAIPMEQICRKYSGFVSLQNFFNAAANRHLSVFREGPFPVEIYSRIIALADTSTQHTCAKVSRNFRALCQERFSLGNNLKILKFEASKFPLGSQPRPWVNINDLGEFVFQDKDTGHITRSGLNVRRQVPIADEKKVTTLCPVVGGVARPSMMTKFRLRILVPTQLRW